MDAIIELTSMMKDLGNPELTV